MKDLAKDSCVVRLKAIRAEYMESLKLLAKAEHQAAEVSQLMDDVGAITWAIRHLEGK